MRKKIRWKVLGMMGAVALLMSGCAKESEPAAAKTETPISYGSSENMRYAGVVGGNDGTLYYTWEDGLIRYSMADGTKTVLDAQGADSLCLTPDALYYVSYSDTGERGIYRSGLEEQERSLVLAANAAALYVVEEKLVFLEQGNVAMVNTDGSEYRTILAGRYDSLTLEGNRIYVRDLDTKSYYQKELTELLQNGEAVLTQDDILVGWSAGEAPIVSDGWVYYETGEGLTNYRTNVESQETQTKSGSTNNLLITEAVVYAGGQKNDWNGGEATVWNEKSDIRLLGFAGKWLLYEEREYPAERMTDVVKVPQMVRLMAYDTSGNANSVALESKAETAHELETAQADKLFTKLLAGDRTVLQNQAAGFYDSLDTKDTPLSYTRIDVDGDGIEELFALTEKKSYLFHAAWDGIYCWMASERDDGRDKRPLQDGTILSWSDMIQEGIHHTTIDLYRYDQGGAAIPTDTYQHMQLDLEKLSVDPSVETHVKEETYYVTDQFTNQSEWTAAIAANITSQLLPDTAWQMQ